LAFQVYYFKKLGSQGVRRVSAGKLSGHHLPKLRIHVENHVLHQLVDFQAILVFFPEKLVSNDSEACSGLLGSRFCQNAMINFCTYHTCMLLDLGVL